MPTLHRAPALTDAAGADWLAVAVRTAPVAVGVSSLRTGCFLEVNDAFCRLFGHEREAVIGHNADELGLWPDPSQRVRLLQVLEQRGSVTQFKALYRHRLGEIGHLQISARIQAHEGDRLLIGFLTDVTDRQELLAGLRTAHSRLGVVLRSSKVLVFCQDTELRYTWVANPALGVSEADVLGRTDEDILGAAAAAPLVALKRQVLDTGRPLRRDVWVANNGQLGCFDLVIEPERDGAGRISGIACAAFDITERMTALRAASFLDPARRIGGLATLIDREPLSRRQSERLARIQAAAHALEAPAPAPSALAVLQRDHAGQGVVVAEHNPVLRELVTALLQEAGLRVLAAGTGVDAFRLCLAEAPDLLLLDAELPQRGGQAAAHAVRALLPQRLPIVAMVSPASGPPDPALLDADLDDLLEKPVGAGPLYDKVLTWLMPP